VVRAADRDARCHDLAVVNPSICNLNRRCLDDPIDGYPAIGAENHAIGQADAAGLRSSARDARGGGGVVVAVI
jgi:hypothetical protein